MMAVNMRAVFLCSQAALPHLEKSSNAHILNLSPPLSLESRWLAPHLAYTLSKYGMTLSTLGMAAEFKDRGIAVNSLWPKTTIATAAVAWLMGEGTFKNCRKPEIMADAAYAIVSTPGTDMTGRAVLDEDILRERGVEDFEAYACEPGQALLPDLYVDA